MLARRRCACAGLQCLSLRVTSVGRVSVAPPGKITAQQGCVGGNQCLPGGAACIADTVIGLPFSHSGKKRLSRVISAYIALPVNRLRYAWHGAGSAQGAADRKSVV